MTYFSEPLEEIVGQLPDSTHQCYYRVLMTCPRTTQLEGSGIKPQIPGVVDNCSNVRVTSLECQRK